VPRLVRGDLHFLSAPQELIQKNAAIFKTKLEQ